MPQAQSTKRTINRLRQYRRQRGLLVKDVARLIGIINPGHVWQWESGRRTPTLKTAIRLSTVIDCPLELLFRDDFEIARRQLEARKRRQAENHPS